MALLFLVLVGPSLAGSMYLPPGVRFVSAPDSNKIRLDEAEVFLGPLVFDTSGNQLLSLGFGLTQWASSYHQATIAETIETIDSKGVARAAVAFVAEAPHNGGGPISAKNGAYETDRMGPGLIDELVVRFNPPLTDSVQAVRVRIDGKDVDFALHFHEAVEKPPVAPNVAAACGALAKCCSVQSTGENLRACSDIVDSAQAAGLADICTSAAESYCPH